jgi:hypothetical protein
MIQHIKSFTLGFLVAGVLFCFSPVLASVFEVEKKINKFVTSFKCRTVDVQDIDLWGGRVLVTARELGVSFVMIAKDSASYDICPVGLGVDTLQSLDKKK